MKSYILLDRSGSMRSNWLETIGALNGFAEDLAQTNPKAKVTLASFDSGGFDLVRNMCKVGDWKAVSTEEVRPRGMTPLLDAIGQLDGVVSGKKASVLILTDGAENASREMTKAAARAVVDGWKAKGYDVVFIGADFDAFGDAGSIGVAGGQTLNVSKGKMRATMSAYAARTKEYAQTGDTNIAWSEEERSSLK